MKRFTNAVRDSVAQENWYSALTTSLILPDICGRLLNPKQASGARYARWFDDWMGHHYQTTFGSQSQPHVFMSGSDCYALRCSLLHQGESDISGQKAQEVRNALNNFHFITPPSGRSVIHCIQSDNTLLLQVDIFSTQMADAVDAWAHSTKEDQSIRLGLEAMLVIHDGSQGIRI